MPQPGEMDFAGLAAKALAEPDEPAVIAAQEAVIPDPTTTEVNTPEESDVEPAVEVASAEPVQSQEETEQKVFDMPDDARVRVKIDGEEQIISYGEYKDRLRKEATVTQRMQNIAQARKELNDRALAIARELEMREQALVQASQPRVDPVQQALIDLLQGKQPAKPRDPNDVLTHKEIQELLVAQQNQFDQARRQDRAEMDASLVNAAQAVQSTAARNAERQRFFSGVDQIAAKPEYRVLTEIIPNVRAHIMAYVDSVGAQNLEQALEASEDWFKDRLTTYKRTSVAKEQAAQKKAAAQKMESNDGATPTIKGKTSKERAKEFVGKNGKPNWDAMFKSASQHSME